MAEPNAATPAARTTEGIPRIGRWLLRGGAPSNFVIGVVGTLMVFSADTEALTVVPLLGALDSEFGMTATQGAWSLSVTGIAAAAAGPLMSRLGDIFGMRRILLVSLTMILIGNLICCLAQGPVSFIVGRAVLGLTAAISLYYALLRIRADSNYGVDKLVALMTAALGAGISFAFILGGLVLEAGGTVRTVLWIIAALSALVLLLTWLFVPDAPVRAHVRIDYVGAVLVAAALTCVVVSLGQANRWGWTSKPVVGLMLAGVALIGVWIVWELHTKHPMIDLRIVGRPEVWPAFLAAALANMLGVSSCLAVSNYIQTPSSAGYGFSGSVFVAGLYLLPVGLMIAFGGAVMAPVIRILGQRNSAILGGVICAALFFWFADNHTHTWHYIVEMLLFGVFYSLTYTAAVSAYIRTSRPGEGGMLTGAARVAGTAVQSLGPSIVTALIAASFIPGTTIPQASNYVNVWYLFAGCGMVIVMLCLFMRNSQVDQRLAPHAVMVLPDKTLDGIGAENAVTLGASQKDPI